jgi:hypothetical protein
VFKADPIAAEVVKRCAGEACFETIVDDLAKTFGAPRERVLAMAPRCCREAYRAAAGLRVVRP